MSNRFSLHEQFPEAVKAIRALDVFGADSKLTIIQQELIKIRASQINQCAFCIDMHTRDARKYGETEQRIYLLNAWKETKLYTPAERALLAMTEEVTQIGHHGLSDTTYAEVVQHFGVDGAANILMAIVQINSWNRIAISLNYQFDK
ncbi:alkylhydroperoxidase AhpD family core domain-containing protein [Chitinophaga jiangningensis]|uniref:Alkylhydroperoxidase AhpD family core domain-containing protein n=1 Tax=Chitinophaga jiangningensis TaxID=1419482 RepID=A0A1M7AMG7_9BACT|nr:carboxymuconolactone decarboxylase family protein [Chitinophaga jiangningensis]SHL43865.1 alkylhydroperoxidase AhpD family core domain-containing protein [Chitinophaga jiangningensis]